MIYEILITLMSFVIVGCVYIIWNLNNKVVSYENRIEANETWITNFTNTVKDVDDKLKQIDSRGTFEADDEVGSTFDQIRDTIKTLDKFILKDEDQPIDDKKEKA